jgi:thioredoxin-like negative regulator of GroEL
LNALIDRLFRGVSQWALLRLVVLLTLLAGLLGAGAGRYFKARRHFQAARQALAELDYAAARNHLDRCLEAWPGDGETYLLAARAARRSAAFHEAEQLLEQGRRFSGFEDAMDLEGLLVRAERGDAQRLESRFRTLVDHQHPATPLICEALVAGFRKGRNLDGMKAYLARWLKCTPNDRQALEWQAEMDSHLEPAQALAGYRRLTELVPGHDAYRLKFADALGQVGQSWNAAAQYECVLRRQPDNPDALLGLARCREEAHRLEEAQQLLNTLLRKQPEHVAALVGQGRLALRTGAVAAAEEALRRALMKAPQDADAAYLVQVCLQAREHSSLPPTPSRTGP